MFAVMHSLLYCDFLRLYETIRLHYRLVMCTLLNAKWYELYGIDDLVWCKLPHANYYCFGSMSLGLRSGLGLVLKLGLASGFVATSKFYTFDICIPSPHMRIIPVGPSVAWFTAFSLPGLFAPWSESANRTLANSLPGTFAPWPFRSLAFSLPGLLAPWNFRSPERIGPGTFAPWNFRSLLILWR